MKAIPVNAETETLAKRLICFESTIEALRDPVRFMAYASARATHAEMKTLRTYLDRRCSSRGARYGAARRHRSALMGLLEFNDGTLSGSAGA